MSENMATPTSLSKCHSTLTPFFLSCGFALLAGGAVVALVAVLVVAGVFAVVLVRALEVELVEDDADDVGLHLPQPLHGVARNLIRGIVRLGDKDNARAMPCNDH